GSRGAPVAPSTCSANQGRSAATSTPSGGTRGEVSEGGAAPAATRRSGDARLAGLHRPPVALRVAGDAADRHVDPVAGGGALLLGLAAPEPVLAVLTGPVAAGLERDAGPADGACARLAQDPGLGPLAGGGEEEAGLADAGGVGGPGQRTGEDQVRDRVEGHSRPHCQIGCSAVGADRGEVGSQRLPATSMLTEPAQS